MVLSNSSFTGERTRSILVSIFTSVAISLRVPSLPSPFLPEQPCGPLLSAACPIYQSPLSQPPSCFWLLQFSPFHWGRQAEEQHPSSNRFLTVNGVRLHYTASGGGGVPVVLIHGNTGDIADSLFRSRLEEAASKRQLGSVVKPRARGREAARGSPVRPMFGPGRANPYRPDRSRPDGAVAGACNCRL